MGMGLDPRELCPEKSVKKYVGKELKDKSVGVDASCWYYDCVNKNKYSNPRSISQTPVNEIVQHIETNVRKLLSVEVRRVMVVFDGAWLRNWRNFEKSAKTQNANYSFLNGKLFSDIAYEVIQMLKGLDYRVSYMVAPNEADAQLAYLALTRSIDIVVTRDTNLIAYGCPRVGGEMEVVDLYTASQLIREHGNYKNLIKNCGISKDYGERFARAIDIFRHQKVYDVSKKNLITYVNPINEVPMCDKHCWFLGLQNSEEPGDQIVEDVALGLRYANPPYEIVTEERRSRQSHFEEEARLNARLKEDEELFNLFVGEEDRRKWDQYKDDHSHYQIYD